MKKISQNSRPVKYFMAKRKGLSKRKSAEIAGYYPTNISKIEGSAIYKEVERQFSYKDEILQKMSKRELAEEQLKVVLQDENLNAKNQAIKQVTDVIEPKEESEFIEESVVIVLGN
jgi:hypothetical protein